MSDDDSKDIPEESVQEEKSPPENHVELGEVIKSLSANIDDLPDLDNP
jgi:hypothetical protein